jgi:hypothetical protein
MSKKTICLRGHFSHDELTGTGTPIVGSLLRRTSTGVVAVHNVEGGSGPFMVAKEDALQGKTVSDSYASGDIVFTAVPSRDSILQARLTGSASYAIGDKLISAGDGKLKKLSALSGRSLGTKQVTTATAAGSVSSTGNASVTVSSALFASNVVVPFAVTNGDTAATWAGLARTALAANSTINAHFTVGGSSTAIVLTARVEAANDATLNVATADVTSAGITEAPTSVATTAGVAPVLEQAIFGEIETAVDYTAVAGGGLGEVRAY